MTVGVLLLVKATFLASTAMQQVSSFTPSSVHLAGSAGYVSSKIPPYHLSTLKSTNSNKSDVPGTDIVIVEGASNSNDPYITFHHPVYQTEITLVGCLHGSASSANDVSTILNQSFTDIVVLELCPTRYKDLMRDLARRKEEGKMIDDKLGGGGNLEAPGGDYFKMVRKTIEARGLATGVAAAVLGGASGISTALSGFDPGLEFITAMKYVEDMNNGKGRINRVDVILADRIVDETLRRVGDLPSVSLEMFQEYLSGGFNWDNTYGAQAQVLKNAIIGNDDSLSNDESKPIQQVNLGKALVRNSQVVQDLARLTIPTFVLLQLANLSLFNGLPLIGMAGADDTSGIGGGEVSFSSSDVMLDTLSMMSIGDWGQLTGDIAFEFISSGLILLLGYVLVALPTVKLILTERDEQLAKGIHDACRIASLKRENDMENSGPGRVVAVLGFLHVNGVRSLLQQRYYSP